MAERIEVLQKNRRVPGGCLLVTIDVVGLYSNIPTDESIDVVMDMLNDHVQDIDMLDLELHGGCQGAAKPMS